MIAPITLGKFTNGAIHSKCAGKNCKRKPLKVLEIRFLHKKGAFCEVCYSELKALDLIENCLEGSIGE